jgi:hypothetical protein
MKSYPTALELARMTRSERSEVIRECMEILEIAQALPHYRKFIEMKTTDYKGRPQAPQEIVWERTCFYGEHKTVKKADVEVEERVLLESNGGAYPSDPKKYDRVVI